MTVPLPTLITLARSALAAVPPGEHRPRQTLDTVRAYLAGHANARELATATRAAQKAHLEHARKANRAKSRRDPFTQQAEHAVSNACFLAWEAAKAAEMCARPAPVGPSVAESSRTTEDADHDALGRGGVARLLFSLSGAFGAVAMVLAGQRPIVTVFLLGSAVASLVAAIVALKGG